MNLIEEFKKIRKEKRMSVNTVSKISGIPLRTIQNWEQKISIPNLENFSKLLNVFGYEIAIKEKGGYNATKNS